MANKTIRLLRADEIECRVSSISKNGVSLLLYKDARVDQRILDETFGIFGWKRSHQCIDGNLYCTVEVFDKETGIWVSKQDAGSTGKSEKEKEKSQASDSFKRACFNWGIERNLTQHLLYGYQQEGQKYRNEAGSFTVMTVFQLQQFLIIKNVR